MSTTTAPLAHTAQPGEPNAPEYPGTPSVINGNGAVAHVMKHVCGGVIGYPITPSTEISENFEAALAEGQLNVWGKHPFFFEPEGEHSAQSGALGAALTGGQFISNASSSQGILYGMESHFVTVGKRAAGFVLQVAARVVSRHSLNVMAGHDDVYALLPAGYTTFFGSNPQEAADLAAISYRTSALSLIPVVNAFDGFATSHVMSEVRLPEPALLKDYLGDPAGRIPCPTAAQEMVYGAKGRVWQLQRWLDRRAGQFESAADVEALRAWLDAHADHVEADNAGADAAPTLEHIPAELRDQWRRQWLGAWQKGTRQTVPALVDPDNPGLTGPVQNQPDFQAGVIDQRTHFLADVPALARRAMEEYSQLTGRHYRPLQTEGLEDADYVFVGLGSVCDDVRAVLPHLRAQGLKVGLVAVTLLQPFPEAELVEALSNCRAVTVLERSDLMSLTHFVEEALFKGVASRSHPGRFPGVPTLADVPRLTTAVFGLGAHDLQPCDLVAAAENMAGDNASPLVYLGSRFFDEDATGAFQEMQNRLAAAYPETRLMALPVRENPQLLPEGALRIRFHSVGGYGTIATGKLMTDTLAGALGMFSKSAPKYGSEKSGAPTNYYITLSPEPVLLTNAELEDVEVVLCPDGRVFDHSNPLNGLVEGGTLILQSNRSPEETWRSLPRAARRAIRQRRIRFELIDAFAIAGRHAPTPELETRMMGIAFIGATLGGVDRIHARTSPEELHEKVRSQIQKKFGSKGSTVVEGNMAVIEEGLTALVPVPYATAEYEAIDAEPDPGERLGAAVSASMAPAACASCHLFDPDYFADIMGDAFRAGTIGRAPVMPGVGSFLPTGTAAGKDKGMFRRNVPVFDASLCTGCMECALACPDAAIPNAVHELDALIATAIARLDVPAERRAALSAQTHAIAERVRRAYRASKDAGAFPDLVVQAVDELTPSDDFRLRHDFDAVAEVLAQLPVARTRPFFDAMENETPGTGGLYSVTIDPWKCSGCLECVQVCGPHALTGVEQAPEDLTRMAESFDLLARTPNTPARFTADATAVGGDLKRLFLDRRNYYAVTGGHGACRGCGEITGTRMVMATSHALADARRPREREELAAVVADLRAKAGEAGLEPGRRERLAAVLGVLEHELYLLEGGPTGQGRSAAVVANATGCSSVYASTMPNNPFTDPWVNSLFQDAQPLAKGMFEGLATRTVDLVRALRVARLEIADAYDPLTQDKALATMGWRDLTEEERQWLPTVLTIGGDGATYDIGFGALSRILASGTPIKAVVLDTGAYSNTGGQASTASYTGQDADLARIGKAHHGKGEQRKELGLLASFHPNTLVVQTTTAMQNHFLANAAKMLRHTDGPAVFDIYAPCQIENGIPDDLGFERGRLAVQSRMSPLFVHDPDEGAMHFDLTGNPDVDALWSTQMLQYVDDAGAVQLKEVPLTPADFAVGETRFRKQFRPFPPAMDEGALPVDQYVALEPEDREGRTPFIWTVDGDRHLVRMLVGEGIVDLVEERRRNWVMLQQLAGLGARRADAERAAEIARLEAQLAEATEARETSLDDIARAMSELAASATAAPAPLAIPGLTGAGAGPATAAPTQAGAGQTGSPSSASDAPVRLDPEDIAKCTDCKTCWQEVPELFERTTVVVDGEARNAARLIPGALDTVEITDEMRARLAKVVANCDAEIIH